MWSKASCLFVVLNLVFAGGVSAVAVVNVDFTSTSGQLNYTPYSGQGAHADPGNDFWNSMDKNHLVLRHLVASDGMTVTGINIEITGLPIKNWSNDNDWIAEPKNLMCDYIFTEYSTGTIEIFGLSANFEHTLYLYGAGDYANQGSTFTFGTGSSSTLPGPYQSTTAITLGEDYAIMDVVSDTNGKITGTWTSNGHTPYGPFNGMQIVIPEPGSFCLFGLCGLQLLITRRKL
jgi:hypothetical protein